MAKNPKDKFVPYDLALRLKNIGFNEECFATYFTVGAWQIDCTEGALNLNNNVAGEYTILAPLWQDAFDWLHDEHHLLAQISRIAQGSYHAIIQSTTDEYLELLREFDSICIDEVTDVYTYKDARLQTLTKMIEKVEAQTHHAEQQ